MLSLNLQPIFNARGIDRPFTFLVNAGFTRHSATIIINNNTKSLRFKHIELLCKVLFCEPNDLFLWTPEKGEHYAENFPLSKLKKSEPIGNWKETLAKMPFKDLKEVTKNIISKEQNES